MKKLPGFRSFSFQHPTFGTEKNPKPSSNWENTIYYLWFQYLRHSKNYIETCENNGEGKCSELYREFGDIRIDFKEWWSQHGAHLFAEPRVEDRIRVLQKGELPEESDSIVTISIPLDYRKEFIMKIIDKLLAEHHKGKRGQQLAKISRARFQVSSSSIKIEALKKALEVYDYREENPTVPLWRIHEKLLGLNAEQKRKLKDRDPNVQAEIRKSLATTITRYIKNVKKSIENAERGLFP